MTTTDVAVIGLGATGSAALFELARRGVRAVGIEQFTPGHDRGSSHGETRIIRLGYFEHPSYVPLLRAAYALWRALEREAGAPLLDITGIIEIGARDSELVSGTLRSACEHRVEHQLLDGAAVMRRFPPFRVPRDCVGVFQPDGGILAAEAAVAALIRLATRAGADVRLGETVRAITQRGDAVRITTDQGTLDAASAIVAAGPWMKKLLANVPAPVTVTRQVLAWFEPFDLAIFARDCFPVFIVTGATGVFYGFPRGPRPGIKFAKHHHLSEEVDPDSPVPPPTAADEAVLRDALAAYLPAANGRLIEAKTCLYTMAPDGDFIIDRLPAAPQVIVASPCSGHGFKFAPAIGEILADLAAGGTPRHDISRFRLARFG